MATHTVIQDIEAEDKFLGPLTLKQFVFGAGAVFFGYLSVFALTKGAAFLLVIFMPPALLGAFLAIPWSSEQPTEVWVLAKLRFKLKPRARIWDQAGLEELVTITAPKKIERQLTNGLNQDEVQSRLKALASTIDTRGWAVKNATLSDSFSPTLIQTNERLLDIETMPQAVPEVDLNQVEDVLNEDTTVSTNFDHMIRTSSQMHMQQSLNKMDRVRRGESIQSVQQPEVHFTPTTDPALRTYSGSVDEDALSKQLRNKRSESNLANSHMQSIPVYPIQSPMAPISQSSSTDDNTYANDANAEAKAPAPKPQAEMTKTSDPAIINLAHNNDLNVETIARQAQRNNPGEDEVVVSLR